MAMSPATSRNTGRRSSGSRAPMAEINVTPFVDVMLVLLIIFMITAPLLVAGVPVELPESRAAALEQDREPVQISIDASGYVYIDDQQIEQADLPPALAQIRGSIGEGEDAPQIMLRADTTLNYGQVMYVMGELNRAGLNSVSMVTTSSSNPQ